MHVYFKSAISLQYAPKKNEKPVKQAVTFKISKLLG